MGIFGLFLQVGILWFLITLFTGSTDANQSLRETWIVIIGMLIVSLLIRFLLAVLFPESLLAGIAALMLSIVALYVLVDKVCGASKKATTRICAWYFGIGFLFSLIDIGFRILSTEPVTA